MKKHFTGLSLVGNTIDQRNDRYASFVKLRTRQQQLCWAFMAVLWVIESTIFWQWDRTLCCYSLRLEITKSKNAGSIHTYKIVWLWCYRHTHLFVDSKESQSIPIFCTSSKNFEAYCHPILFCCGRANLHCFVSCAHIRKVRMFIDDPTPSQ